MPSQDAATEQMLVLRYGSGRTPRSVIVLGVVVAAVVTALLGWIGASQANPPVRWNLLAFHTAGPTRVDVTFEVRRSPDATVTCVLRAQDAAHVDIGYALVTLPADGTDYVQRTYPLATLAPAFTAEVTGCGLGTGAPASAPLPDFGPGVVPPPQVPPGRAPSV